VNVAQVVEVRRRSHGLLELTLLSGANVPVSRSNNRAVRKAIGERAPRSNF
jgi:DNA-binding LytR/AlgR family response regulator